MTLDFMPSPVPDRPGLFIRDPYRYSDAMLIIPPPLVECLRLFNGENTDLDLRSLLVRITGDLQVGEIEQQMVGALSSAGFLEDQAFAGLKQEREQAFATSPRRSPAHAGSAYPDELLPLRETMERYMDHAGTRAHATDRKLFGIAAPHVSPEGGWQSYQAAYAVLGPEYKDRTFVILGTSHYGEPERFGLTRKPFVTPFGESPTDLALVDWLAARAGDGAVMEDYCHSFEHTIEFQVLFLQHLYGPDIRILPILCGPYAQSLYVGGKPEDTGGVQRFLEALGELASREGERLFWVLGIDMAHMGSRYRDPFQVTAGTGRMAEVAEQDRRRIDRILNGDTDGFWDLLQQTRDDLKWCGSAPLYTFLKAAVPAGGELLRYEQWNIDPQSVVSFAGLSFHR
jgi:AmmeMemoRadiSam system protein B